MVHDRAGLKCESRGTFILCSWRARSRATIIEQIFCAVLQLLRFNCTLYTYIYKYTHILYTYKYLIEVYMYNVQRCAWYDSLCRLRNFILGVQTIAPSLLSNYSLTHLYQYIYNTYMYVYMYTYTTTCHLSSTWERYNSANVLLLDPHFVSYPIHKLSNVKTKVGDNTIEIKMIWSIYFISSHDRQYIKIK